MFGPGFDSRRLHHFRASTRLRCLKTTFIGNFMNNDKHVDKKQHLLELVKDFRMGMLATKSMRGFVHGRPMSLAEVDDNGNLYFAAGLDSPKVKEIEADAHAAVLFQASAKWVSLSGTVSISKDRSLIDRLWKEDWKLWFSEGKNDPNLCMLIFDPSEGEYWDNTGSRGIRFIIEAAKAYVQGHTVDTSKIDENAKVKL